MPKRKLPVSAFNEALQKDLEEMGARLKAGPFPVDPWRRRDILRMTPEERQIHEAIRAVEALGAHPLLTKAVVDLSQAGEWLADWVDQRGSSSAPRE